ncbi:hypothetical protein [Nocardioides limicola]|uniref:hypothetical protein n=1 Tax=Nocardioides limicola TaxID=2803368 RepID=UPI00193C1B1A|nr:hypothetical protein [Nocardioides sp. DJM-14]
MEEPKTPETTRARPWLVIVLLALVVALAVALALTWRDYAPLRAAETATAEAEEAAIAAVLAMTTYDHRTVEEDFTWVEDAGTVKFRDYFEGTADNAIDYIKTIQARATGEVIDSAAAYEDADHVRVLLHVDQEILSRDEETPRVDQPRVTMHMKKVDGVWLVDQVQVNNVLTN